MTRKLVAQLTCLSVVATLAFGGLAAAAPAVTLKTLAPITQFKKVETWGWHAELPADWKETLNEKKDAAHPYEGMWRYYSPSKNFRVRIKVRRSEAADWKARTKSSFEKLYKRMPTFKLLGAKSTRINGRQVFYVLGQVKRVRSKHEHEHLIFHLLVRFPTRKLRMVATFVTALDRLDDAMPIIERFTDSFAIVEPASVKAAIKKLRAGAAGK